MSNDTGNSVPRTSQALKLLGFRDPDAVAEVIRTYDQTRELALLRRDRTRLIALRTAAAEFARADLPERISLSNPEAVARYLYLRYAERDQEVMGALFLDVRNRMIGEAELFRGTLSRAAVEPRAILKQALLISAAGVLLFHTHPSSDPSASSEDIAFTRRLADAGEILGIRLIDHLILGTTTRWVSLRRHGGW